MTLDNLYNSSENIWLMQSYYKLIDENKVAFFYTNKEKYITNCFQYHSQILDTCKQLEHVSIFLKRYDRKYFTSFDVSQSYFIQYHIEAYCNKLFTLMELIIQYTNIIYHLGLKPKQCYLTNIEKKLDNNLTSFKILKQFYNVLESWRTIRNDIVHRNKFNKDREFEQLSSEELLWSLSEKGYFQPKIDWITLRPKDFVNWFLKQERKKMIEVLKKNNLLVNQNIHDFNKSTINYIKKKFQDLG